MLFKSLDTVRLTPLDPAVSDSQLYELFQSHGIQPTNHSICDQFMSHPPYRVVTLSFASESQAKKAASLDGRHLGGSRIRVDRDFFGLTPLYSPTTPHVDVIAVHGLNGHAYATWVHYQNSSSQEGPGPMWLRDFLPKTIPKARISTYGYNSALIGPNTSVSTLKDFAKDLLQRIIDDRKTEADQNRPIIFVCHSLGGLVVKKACILAANNEQQYPGLRARFHTICFLATPHRGSKHADYAQLLTGIAKIAFQHPAKQLINTLRLDSTELLTLTEDFKKLYPGINIVSFYERRTSPLGELVVDDNSAILGISNERTIPMDANHNDTCKFRNSTHELFTPVVTQIKSSVDRVVLHTPGGQEGFSKSVFEIPNTRNLKFSGREVELALLEERLASPTLNIPYSYPVVAIYGLGGVGKTQLVTEYLYRYARKRPEYSAFWVSAASYESINSDLILIGKRLKSMIEKESRSGPAFDNPLKTLTGRELVKAWLASQGNWILVLDNYDDAQINIRNILPSRAAGSVIITTRDRRVVGNLANSGIELNELSSDEAVRLFLNLQNTKTAILEINDLYTHPDYIMAQRVIQELHGFPLAIDQAAAFMRENCPISLAEYLEFLKPRTEDRELLLRFKERNPTYPESIMTTWEISFRYLEKHHQRASQLLQLLGFFSHDRISETLLNSAVAERRWHFESLTSTTALDYTRLPEMTCLTYSAGFRVAAGVLSAFSLITRTQSDHELLLSVHPLVHEWIRLRLNLNKELQARLSISAALTLYKSFPFEMVIDDIRGFRGVPSPAELSRMDLVKPHLETCVWNLQEYAKHSSLPVDCISLLLALDMMKWNCFDIVRNAIRKLNFERLGKWLPELLRCVHETKNPAFSIAWRILRWRQTQDNNELWLETAKLILKIMGTPDQKINSVTSSPMMLLVLMQSIFEFCRSQGTDDIVLQLISPKEDQGLLSSGNDRPDANITEKRQLVCQIINQFRQMVDFDTGDVRFNDSVALYFEVRCASILLVEYWEHPDRLFSNGLSLVPLTHLQFHERLYIISFSCKLEWERKPFRNMYGIKKAYEFGLLDAENSTIEQNGSTQGEQSVLLPFTLGYISSSWGRDGSGAFTTNRQADDKHLSEYIRRTVFDVIETISDPDQTWVDDQGVTTTLSLNERRYAIDLFKQYKKCISTLKSERMNGQKAHLTLFRVFRNLEEWDSMFHVFDNLLHLEAVESYHSSAGGLKLWNGNLSISSSHHDTSVTRYGQDQSPPKWSTSSYLLSYLSKITFQFLASSNSKLSEIWEDPWVDAILARTRTLSGEQTLQGFLDNHPSSIMNETCAKNGIRLSISLDSKEDIIFSNAFAHYVMKERQVPREVVDCLSSEFVDEALEALVLGFEERKMVMFDTTKLRYRIQWLQTQKSTLARCLARFSLIVEVMKFPRPPNSVDIKGAQSWNSPSTDDEFFVLEKYMDNFSGLSHHFSDEDKTVKECHKLKRHRASNLFSIESRDDEE